MRGKKRCHRHGGRSNGPVTPDGKARAIAAMRAGRQRWVEETREKVAHGELDRFPNGRKSGAAWVSWKARQREMADDIRAAQAEDDRRHAILRAGGVDPDGPVAMLRLLNRWMDEARATLPPAGINSATPTG
jgi:hypothetical protein